MDIELRVGDIDLLPLIVAIVEGAKELGMSTNLARLLTGVLSVGAYALMLFVNAYPEYAQYVVAGLTMIGLFLGATGLYAIGKGTARSLRGR